MASLIRFSPWSALAEMQRDMDRAMTRLFGGSGYEPGEKLAAWAPAVDVFARGEDLVVRAELPGVDPEKDVDITVEDGVLRIRGERKSEHREERENFFHMETSYGSFERRIPLPQGVNTEGITAVHKQGILEVTVPSGAQVSSTKKIPVQLEQGNGQKAIESQSAEAPAEAPEA